MLPSISLLGCHEVGSLRMACSPLVELNRGATPHRAQQQERVLLVTKEDATSLQLRVSPVPSAQGGR